MVSAEVAEKRFESILEELERGANCHVEILDAAIFQTMHTSFSIGIYNKPRWIKNSEKIYREMKVEILWQKIFTYCFTTNMFRWVLKFAADHLASVSIISERIQ